MRKTHPNFYWVLMLLAATGIALGCNFIFLQPAFLIWDGPNELWGGIFLVISVAKIVALNVYRRLRWLRATMAFTAAYMAFLAVGTAEPYVNGVGSLQLPILYVGLALFQVPLLMEPFVNPETAKQ